jgi:hypothetical protein
MTPKVYAYLFFAVAGLVAQQQPRVPRVTGFFSDMRSDPAGDVEGTEVWIVYARDRYWATVQEAEGEPNPPVIVPIEISGVSKVRFTITAHLMRGDGTSAPDLVRRYEGTVSKSGLLLSTPDSPPTLLKRRNSYWQ